MVATCDPRAGNRRVAGAHDGRRRDRRGDARPAQTRPAQAAPGRLRSLARRRRSAWRRAEATFRWKCGAAKSSASPASPATARPNCSPRFRANGWRRATAAIVIDGRPVGQLGVNERRAHGRRLSCPKSASATAPRRDETVRECAADRPRRERHGANGLHQQARDACARRSHDQRPSTCASPARSGGASACRAAICRNSSSGAKSCASPACWWSISRPGASMPAPPPTIRQALIDLAGRGAAVLVISQDLDELFEIADRIAVMFHGELSRAAAGAQADARGDRPADGRRRSGRSAASEDGHAQLVLERAPATLDGHRGRCRR